MASLALYLTTFTFYAVATVCTITAIFLPNWLVYSSTHNIDLHISYGLTKHCSSLTQSCQPFPSRKTCSLSATLCHTWKSASFLSFSAALLEGITLIAYITVFNGGYLRRLNGWKALCLLHFLNVAMQLPATLLILHNLRTEDLFEMPGWRVGASWVLTTVSYALLGFATVVVGVLGKFSPDEYTLISNL